MPAAVVGADGGGAAIFDASIATICPAFRDWKRCGRLTRVGSVAFYINGPLKRPLGHRIWQRGIRPYFTTIHSPAAGDLGSRKAWTLPCGRFLTRRGTMPDRFYSNTPITGELAQLDGQEAHHLAHVLRAKVGDIVTLFDGTGCEFSARVETIGRSKVDLSGAIAARNRSGAARSCDARRFASQGGSSAVVGRKSHRARCRASGALSDQPRRRAAHGKRDLAAPPRGHRSPQSNAAETD